MEHIGTTALCLLVLMVYRHYCKRKEEQLLKRLESMLIRARNGTFHPEDIDESMVSSIENSMRVFLQDSMVNAELLQERKAGIETLISDISHQAVTPLSNIMIYSQLLEEELSGTECGKQAKAVRQQAEKLNFLIDSLVKASRLENGIIKTQTLRCSLNELAEDVMRQGEEKAAKKSVRLTFVPAPESVEVLCDPKWTAEACFNILDNALKYGLPSEGGDGGEIVLTVRRYPMFGRIDIADNGMGISEEEIPKIFGRFYRSAAAGEKPGVGLGLYLAREIIQKQGGYIKVSSKESKGAVFSVFLPICGQN